MKYLLCILFVCALLPGTAQTNFVQNPDFERYDTCPYDGGQIIFCKGWQNAVVPDFFLGGEYFNACAAGNISAGCPEAALFYQYPHSANGMAAVSFYYDKTLPAPFPEKPFDNREYLQSKLVNKLNTGQNYCVSFWINLAEASGYAHNKIGVYLDDGSINTAVDSGGEEITSVVPQVYTDSIIKDTMNWIKIEGSFVATGTETYITIGNFFPNAATAVVVTNYWFTAPQYSYYLIDDVSVIPIDLAVDAGKDSHAAPGKPVQIGRIGDTTAQGLDCKWYHKGMLIDSGAIISVKGATVVGAVDTYVVVQTICGLVKTDTVRVTTVPVGIPLPGEFRGGFTVYPNPSNGAFTITYTAVIPQGSLHAAVYDLLGRIVYRQRMSFNNNTATIKVDAADGVYILELTDEEGNTSRQRVVIK